jgi:TRAP-type mannitol/chloroaromatic compound transport system permease small subunit
MQPLSSFLDTLSERTGQYVAWLAITMVVLQFSLVVARYLFGVTAVMLDESLLYMHGTLFLVAAGYTLKLGAHVRVDLVYRDASPRARSMVNLVGGLLFLVPLCLWTLWSGFPFVDAAWQSQEGSQETSGLPFLYVYKGVILVFAVLLLLQAISESLKACLSLSGKLVDTEDDDALAL